jgi:hypothetical protein
MATYHVTAEPRSDEIVGRVPIVPVDFMAASEANAIEYGASIITANIREGQIYDPHGRPNLIDEAANLFKQWRVVAQRVRRPAVNLMPHGAVDAAIRNGVVISYSPSPSIDPNAFDILVDGRVAGCLRRRDDEMAGRLVWRIVDATGRLRAVTYLRWADAGAEPGIVTEWRLSGVLDAIRAALLLLR